jgi:hypothetical protein
LVFHVGIVIGAFLVVVTEKGLDRMQAEGASVVERCLKLSVVALVVVDFGFTAGTNQ